MTIDNAPPLIDIQIQQLQDDIDDIKKTLNDIKEVLVKAEHTITTVGDQVMPTVQALTESPMLKMLMPKGKTTSRGGKS